MSAQDLNNTRIKIFCFLLLFFACIGSVRNQYSSSIRYQLYTRNNKFHYEELYLPHTSTWVVNGYTYQHTDRFMSTNLNADKPTKIIVHGWQSGSYFEPLVAIKDNYLTQGDYNVIMIDWSPISAQDYITAVRSLRTVAFHLAQLVALLRKEGFQDIHAIGFSLGAHIPGIASHFLGQLKFNRITGLDPAKPFLMNVPLEDKLDATDADFVDVYHTEVIIEGKNERCGHVDFYINWGGIQPGCGNFNIVCSHFRAPIYFAESIISKVGFWGYRIDLFKIMQARDRWILAGAFVDKKATGSYYIATNSQSPYAKGASF